MTNKFDTHKRLFFNNTSPGNRVKGSDKHEKMGKL